jgi:hypothetical protein
MTTIITRLYADIATAREVAGALMASGHAAATIDVISRDGAADTADRMRAARVSAAAAARYAPAVQDGRALVVVRAPFAPMGAARHAMKVVDRTPSIKVGVADEDEYIREQPSIAMRDNLLRDHPLVMTNPHRPLPHGHILGSNPILAPRERRSAIAGGKHMSRLFWPMRLVSARAKEGTSAIRGGWLFSSMFGIPTLLR